MSLKLAACALLLVGCGEVTQTKVDAAVTGDSRPIDASPTTARIVDVMAPAGVEVETGSGNVVATLEGPPNTELTITFTGDKGSYTPPSVMVTTNASGQAMATTVFSTTERTPGTAMGTATITVPSGAAPHNFMIPIVGTKFGNTMQYAEIASFSPNYLLGEPLMVPRNGVLRKLGFIHESGGPSVKVGIYRDVGGNPTDLVAQLPITVTQAGTVEVPLPSPVNLTAGTYWFLAVYDTVGKPYYTTSSTNTISYISHTFASPLPTSFPASHTDYTMQSFNFYLVVGL